MSFAIQYRFLILAVALFATMVIVSETNSLDLENREMLPPNLVAHSDEGIEYLNKMNTTWKSRRYFPPGTPDSYFKRLMGALPTPDSMKLKLKKFIPRPDKSLPTNYDPRRYYPYCRTMRIIRDQADCGDCWAFAAAEALSDRICIQGGNSNNSSSTQYYSTNRYPTYPHRYSSSSSSTTNDYNADFFDEYGFDLGLKNFTRTRYGNDYVMISPTDLLACCKLCCDGCIGGYPDAAWRYMQTHGVVTGGGYDDTQFCRPYPFAPCGFGSERQCQSYEPKPRCKRFCIPQYPIPYQQDKHYVSSAYSLGRDIETIMRELYLYGPVEATMMVYQDFMNYQGGVYQRHSNNALGGHAVKMMGWGVENGVPYWLCANSWSSGWGENGYFKIYRGRDECGIESGITAGMPA